MTFLYRRSVVEMNKTNTIRIFLEDTLASVEPRVPGQDVTVAEVLDEAVHCFLPEKQIWRTRGLQFARTLKTSQRIQ